MRISMFLALSFVLECVSNVRGQGGECQAAAAAEDHPRAKCCTPRRGVGQAFAQGKDAGLPLDLGGQCRSRLAVSANASAFLDNQAPARRSPFPRADQEDKEPSRRKAFQEFVVYGAKFLGQGGPYTASNRKYVLEQVTQSQVQALIDGSSRASSLSKPDRAEIARLLCDPQYEVQQAPENPDGKGLEKTGSNYYEKGITGPEVMAVLDKTLKPNLNSRVIRSGKELACETLTTQSPEVVAGCFAEGGCPPASRPTVRAHGSSEETDRGHDQVFSGWRRGRFSAG